ncbi:S8 family serine peptidase [Adlercreutzia shanghongiae]|uniref:S8 family serine peptidase n=1 Tax=Adlercreutzia shanghongiae TaxID=3111773 RepID=A0ABU6J089_9ACTN|nr:S8 family serine peptidase [Adlercreutzia sp. R22]MEC4295517.1 S8 family serine peptidase [Adlercreutzia sp. R22]
MKNAGFKLWQKSLAAVLSVLLAFTAVWASPLGGGFNRAEALDSVPADAVPMSDGSPEDGGAIADSGIGVDSAALGAENAVGHVPDTAEDDASEAADDAPDDGADGAGADVVLAQVDAEEAQLAAEERATDAVELGYVPGQVVVVYEEDASLAEQNEVAEVLGPEQELEPATFESGDAAVVEIAEEVTVETAVEAAKAEDSVKYAFPNYLVESFETPTAPEQAAGASPLSTGDEMASKQWYLSAVKAPAAWSALAASAAVDEPVRVAVLDTGASITHPDLLGPLDLSRSGENVWIDMDNGKVGYGKLRGDGYLNGTDEMPFYSTHGTHVAGIVAAKAGNGGVLGVASGGSTSLANKIASITAIDIFSYIGTADDGTKYSSATVLDILYGLMMAREKGCDIVNMSLGFYTDNDQVIDVLNEKTKELDDQGIVQICAAGNDWTSQKAYPAACDATLSVISLSKRGAISNSSTTYSWKTWESADGYMRSWFSNYGEWCDIAAPGENIYSTGVLEGTLEDGYIVLDGTSMACPVVAAVAAMVRAANPELSSAEVKDVLCSTATDLNVVGKDTETGWGLVNAEAAVKAALPASDPGAEPAVPDVPEEEPPASLAAAKVTASTMTYTGNALAPTVSVMLGGATLVQGRDYRATISPSTVKNAGTYTVTIEGVGAYQGTAKGSFKVNPANISTAQIQAIGSQEYTGKAVTPQPKVTWQGVPLVSGTDYTVSYGNNVNAGTAKITVTGKGNFSGSKTASFSIVKVDRNVWKTIGGKTYYYGANGQPVKWSQKIGGYWYYFNGSGVMQKGWITWNNDGTKSYFDSNGRARTGWQTISGKRYYFSPASGRSLRWSQKISGYWYYFNGQSQMQTGWVTWNNDKTKSYFDASGRARTGFQRIGGKTYYFNPSTGRSLRWSQKIGGHWYYFNGQSQMQTGWVTWNNDKTKSYFDASGRARTGFQKIGGKTYYFSPANGRSLRCGQKIGGSFYYFNGQSQMHTGWLTWNNDKKRSYFDPKTGKAYAGWHRIGSKNYYFDPLTYKTR